MDAKRTIPVGCAPRTETASSTVRIHFHLLFLDGIYVSRDDRPPRFQRVPAPDQEELSVLIEQISRRVGRCLQRQGLLEQDVDRGSFLKLLYSQDPARRLAPLSNPLEK